MATAAGGWPTPASTSEVLYSDHDDQLALVVDTADAGRAASEA